MARSAKQQVVSRQREQEAVRLRLAGCSYHQIAATLEMRNPGSAYKAFRRGIERQSVEQIREAFHLANERYLAILWKLWPSVVDGDDRALTAALAVMDRIEKLHGLDHKDCKVMQKLAG